MQTTKPLKTLCVKIALIYNKRNSLSTYGTSVKSQFLLGSSSDKCSLSSSSQHHTIDFAVLTCPASSSFWASSTRQRTLAAIQRYLKKRW